MDKIEELAQLRENLVDDIEARHINRLNIALENLEKDVVKLANSLPLRDNKLFEARLAVELRPKIKALIDKHYVLWADGTVREYDKVAKQIVDNMKILPISENFKTLTELDIETIINSVKKTNRVVVIEEGWQQSGVGAEIIAVIIKNAFDFLDAPPLRFSGEDVPLPYAENLEKLALPSTDKILKECLEILQ